MGKEVKTSKNKKLSFKEITGSSILSVTFFFGTIITLLAIYESIVQFLGDSGKWLSDIELWLKIVLLFLIASLATIIKLFSSALIKYNKLQSQLTELQKMVESNGELDEEKKELIKESIVKILQDALRDRKYQEVISIGVNLSLPLWYSGHYSLRVKIGELVEKAAFEVGDTKTRCQMLIEDLGWTHLRLRNIEIGIDNIEKGIALAMKINDYYWLSQGYRNIADHYLRRAQKNEGHYLDNIKECDKYLIFSYENLNKVEEETIEKIVLQGNVNYTYARYYYQKQEYDKALEHIDLSLESYKKGHEQDPEKNAIHHFKDKQIKLYALKGDIYYDRFKDSKLGGNPEDLNNALIAYEEGYTEAREYNVNAQLALNGLNMFGVYHERKQLDKCEQILKDIQSCIQNIGDRDIIARYDEYCNLLKGNE